MTSGHPTSSDGRRILVGLDRDGKQCEPAPWVQRYEYGPWRIERATTSLSPAQDWCWQHKNFDGAEDANDSRYGREPSLNAALDACDEWEPA